jgi:hypothetical protein
MLRRTLPFTPGSYRGIAGREFDFCSRLSYLASTRPASLIMLNEWDLQNAEKHFTIAISLKANYATSHNRDAEWLSIQGRMGEARKRVPTPPNWIRFAEIPALLHSGEG